jgi:hypothetical protein
MGSDREFLLVPTPAARTMRAGPIEGGASIDELLYRVVPAINHSGNRATAAAQLNNNVE